MTSHSECIKWKHIVCDAIAKVMRSYFKRPGPSRSWVPLGTGTQHTKENIVNDISLFQFRAINLVNMVNKGPLICMRKFTLGWGKPYAAKKLIRNHKWVWEEISNILIYNKTGNACLSVNNRWLFFSEPGCCSSQKRERDGGRERERGKDRGESQSIDKITVVDVLAVLRR